MAVETIIKKQSKALKTILDEVKIIKNQLEKFMFLIPEESIKEYKNSAQIKRAYLKTIKLFPPK